MHGRAEPGSTWVMFATPNGRTMLCVMAMRHALFFLLTTYAFSQQTPPSSPAKVATSIAEPDLPIVSENACPFEGCTFREWTVEKDSILDSSWQDGRKPLGELKSGERVQGLTGVHITRQPDRFLVTEPIPALGLKVGEVVLQYGEWGEGTADLWAGGQWHKNYDWGQTENSQLVLSEANLKLVRHGVKEWWVRVKRSDGLTGWVLADGNFGHMDQLGDPPDDSPSTSDQNQGVPKFMDIPEPRLPIVNKDACPGEGGFVARWKIQREQPYYSYQEGEFVQLGTLWEGQQVNVLDGVEVILKPDRLLVTRPIPALGLQNDDVVLRYGRYRKGTANLWAKGEWGERDGLATVEKDGSGCRSQCDSVVFEQGTVEHWVEIRTSTGQTGWVLSSRLTNDASVDSGNFGNLCATDRASSTH